MVTDPIKFVYVTGDGTTTDFSYAFNGTVGFDADVAEDVKAAILNPDGTRDTSPNFAVLKDAYGNFTGKIRFATAPVANAIIYIYRATPETQETEYRTSSGFDAQTVEDDFDKLTKIAQETDSHARNKTLQLDMFQEVGLALQKMTTANQNQYLQMDFANKLIKAGLFMELMNPSGRFRVSNNGADWTFLPKSNDVQEFRQRTLVNPLRYIFEYRIGGKWYSVGSNGEPLIMDHNDLDNRNAADCHPQSAITGLVDLLKTLAVKTTDFQTGITNQNKGITQTEYKVLDDKINTAALSGTNIGTYWFGLTGNQSGFVVPNPTSADQNYYDFTTSNFYTAKTDLSGWNLAGSNPPPTDVDVNIIISSKFWDITEQNNQQGGMAMWSHTNNKWGYVPRIISFEDANLTGIPTAPDLTDSSPDNQIVNKKTLFEHSNGGAMPVGAIFTTPRTGTIAGAVEANGGEYNIADYSGAGSIGALLAAGNIAYVSKAAFQTQVANTGACDSFGWNGAGDATFLVPKLNPWHIGKNAPVVGNGKTLGLTNGTQNAGLCVAGINNIGVAIPYQGSFNTDVGTPNIGLGLAVDKSVGITPDPEKSGVIADLSETTNLRVMVQLATGATDQALETCTSVLSDISALKYDYVVDFQAPTAANNYTWYRKYKSGWIRQGGAETLTGVQEKQITFPVVMKDGNYTPTVTGAWSAASGPQMEGAENRQTTGMRLTSSYQGVTLFWTVEGQAA